ncbi:MAG TPA: nucleotidyltransferase domain-containing protein [Firmicutes bacterium]|nr:nucleotidyltransferase domain-containing protein [Bacillota bacterium]
MTRNKGNLPKKQSSGSEQVSNKSDLAYLFGSETRAFVIWVLLNHPDHGFTQAEISRLTGKDSKDVKRAIDILIQLDLITMVKGLSGVISPYTSDGRFDPEGAFEEHINREIQTSGFSKRYYLNENHPWIPGLKIIFNNSYLGVIHLLQAELKAFPVEKIKPDVAFVYGSYVIGEETVQSDIDMIVVGCHDRETLAEIVDNLEQRIDRSINYVEYTCEEWAQALKEEVDFARSIMTKPKIFLLGDNEKLEKIAGT